MAESVETLHGGAETPKRKSSQQVLNSIVKGCQGNLMLDAKQRVAGSSPARRIFDNFSA
ncbi:MAG: hypothetical protein ABH872_05600 [Candidatus Omnitrophota bacterium]